MKVWPVRLFAARTATLRLAGRVIQGGQSLSGITATVKTDGGGLWMLDYEGIFLRKPDQIRAWRAWEALLDGGATNVIVPYVDYAQAPRPLIGGVVATPLAPVPHEDGSPFDDGSGYGTPLISAALVGDVALRATILVIDVAVGEPLRGGEHFTLVHAVRGPRLYRVMSVETVEGTQATVEIRPPLREAALAGDTVDFDAPRCVMKLSSPEGMALPLQAGRLAAGQAAGFVEAF